MTHQEMIAHEERIELGRQMMQQQIDRACRQADPEAPASLTDLVRTIATQTIATPEQVAALRAELEPWATQLGDRLDSQLLDRVVESHDWTTKHLADEREQWEWCSAHPEELSYPLAEAEEAWTSAQRSEVVGREYVAGHCAALVAAGEHGTEGRGRAICDDWQSEWSSIVD